MKRPPNVTFRVSKLSSPFDMGKKIEVTYEIVLNFGGVKLILEKTQIVPAGDGAILLPGRSWIAEFHPEEP